MSCCWPSIYNLQRCLVSSATCVAPAILGQTNRSVIANLQQKDTTTVWDKAGSEPSTLWPLDNPPYLLCYSCPESRQRPGLAGGVVATSLGEIPASLVTSQRAGFHNGAISKKKAYPGEEVTDGDSFSYLVHQARDTSSLKKK